MDLGLLIARIVIGGLLFAHGTQKLFGWFGGYGRAGTAGFFGSLGFRLAPAWAIIAGVSEAAAGVLLVLGLLTPLAAAATIGMMAAAALVVHRGKGLWATNGGYELPLTYATLAVALAFTGPGRYSLDNALDLDMAGTTWGLLAIGLGLLGAVMAVATRATPATAEDTSASRREAA